MKKGKIQAFSEGLIICLFLSLSIEIQLFMCWFVKLIIVLFVFFKYVRNFANKQRTMSGKYLQQEERLARYAKAMGHPARVAILNFLVSQDSCFFGDIHDVLPIAKATVSQHLKELKDAGLIQGEIEAPKVRYCINRENWKEAERLMKDFFCGCKDKDICCR